MKQFRTLLFLCLFALCAFGQSYQCQFNAAPTVAGVGTSFDNRAANCYNWRVTYTSTGFSAISLQLESAPDNAGTPGTWTAFTGTAVVTDGTNPSTSTNSALIGIHANAAWVRINLVTATGTGTVKYNVFGASGVSASNSYPQPVGPTNGTNGQGLTSNGAGAFGTPVTFATIATSGSATDLSTGTIPASRIGSLANGINLSTTTGLQYDGSVSATTTSAVGFTTLATCPLATARMCQYAVGRTIQCTPGATQSGSGSVTLSLAYTDAFGATNSIALNPLTIPTCSTPAPSSWTVIPAGPNTSLVYSLTACTGVCSVDYVLTAMRLK